jgi:dipeptidase E
VPRRLLLTSTGITNGTIREALADLLGKPFAEASVVVIVTASLADPGDHGWLLENLARTRSLGWRELDVIDLNGLPRDVVVDRLRHADVLFAEGGNHYHLARSIVRNGLAEDLLALLEDRVWVGSSAGSMLFSSHLSTHSAEVIGDVAELHLLGADAIEPPFGLLDWYLKPHLGSPDFPERDDAWAEDLARRADFPILLIDDDTAVRVRGEEVDIVSEGRWRSSPGAPS